MARPKTTRKWMQKSRCLLKPYQLANFLLFFIIPFFLIFPAEAQQVDAADADYEAQLYNIYVNYYSQPTSPQEWQALIVQRQAETYTVQKGDTLWGISKTFFGDGNYWPKIWSLNAGITNPHLIHPGMNIQFVLGDEVGAPAFTMTEPSDTLTSNDSGSGQGSDNSDSVEIPPPLHQTKPVIMNLPPSLPNWQVQNSQHYDELGFSYVPRPILKVKDVFPLSAYVSGTQPAALGTVTEMEDGGSEASNYQYLFVRLKKGAASVGQKFLVVRGDQQLVRPNAFVKGDLGFGIAVEGEIRLTDQLRGDDDEMDYFRAMVLNSFSPVAVGSQVTQGKLSYVKINSKGPTSNVVAQIIGGQYDERRQMFGPEALVFLNRGQADGLAVGDVLPIRSNRKARFPETDLKQNIRPVGYLQIAEVEPHYATAIIIKAWDEVMAGDLTGTGGVSSVAVSSPQTDKAAPQSDDKDFDDNFDLDEKSDKPESSSAKSAPDSFDTDFGGQQQDDFDFGDSKDNVDFSDSKDKAAPSKDHFESAFGSDGQKEDNLSDDSFFDDFKPQSQTKAQPKTARNDAKKDSSVKKSDKVKDQNQGDQLQDDKDFNDNDNFDFDDSKDSGDDFNF